jgi:hypothetical protein
MSMNPSTDSLTGLCSTTEEALLTGQKYERLGVPVSYKMLDKCIAVVAAEACVGKDGKEYPAGVLLTSVNCHEPLFT